MARKGLLERVNDRVRGVQVKGFTEAPFWALDTAQYPWWNAATPTQERIENDFIGYVNGAYKGDGIVFATIDRRQQVFSQARFQWREYRQGQPGKLFGSPELALLENPWPNGTTGELLAYMEIVASLAGNAYLTTVSKDGSIGNASRSKPGRRISRLRPDWMTLVIDAPSGDPWGIDAYVAGYLYQPRVYGSTPGSHPAQLLTPDEVCHYSPRPDPSARFRGMSWLTPIVKEIQGDIAATDHKLGFFRRGAPQPLTARILTPSGWSTMGQMRVGGEIIGSDGKPRRVLAVYPQGSKDVYKVTFSGGVTTECTADHLWTVATIYDRKCGTSRTMTLAQIMENGVRYQSGPPKWSVQLVDPVEFDPVDNLVVHPYLLGSLLGDGCMRGSCGATLAAHTNDADEQQALLTPLIPKNMVVSRRDRSGFNTEFLFANKGRGPVRNPLRSALVEIGVWGCRGYEKFIPERYMRASVNHRIALLQGIVDTDGSIAGDEHHRNMIRIDSTSERLARDVGEIASSLGAVVSVRQSREGDGTHRPQWRVNIGRLPEWIMPCRLTRKAQRYRSTHYASRYRYIINVEPVGRQEVQCIGVASPDHLYVTDNYLLTHNTPSLVVKGIPATTPEEFDKLVTLMEAKHAGIDNAYRTLYLTAGADAAALGADLKQLDFKVTQGGGEVRLAVAGGVPASILGISEGLSGSSLNAGNFGAARRLFVDTTIWDLWSKVAPSMQVLVDTPVNAPNAVLSIDDRNIPFLREDAKDDAEIRSLNAMALRQLTDAGWDPDAAVDYINTNDVSRLSGNHQGLFSVQLRPPNSGEFTSPPSNGSSSNGSGTITDPAVLAESTNSN